MKAVPASKILPLAALAAAIVVPGLSILLLGSLSIVVESDVRFPLVLADILGYLNELVTVAAVFVTGGCIAAAELTHSSQRLVSVAAYASPFVLYAISIAVDVAFWGDDALEAVYLLTIVFNCLFELVRYLLVRLTARRIARRSAFAAPEFFSLEGSGSKTAVLASLLIFATLLVSNLTETLSLLVSYGAPVNTNELVYLILPYPTAIVYSLLGYMAICVTIKLLTKESHHANP